MKKTASSSLSSSTSILKRKMVCKRLWTISFWWLLTLTCLNVLLTTKLLQAPNSSSPASDSLQQTDYDSKISHSTNSTADKIKTCCKNAESGDVNSHVGDHMNVINLDLGRYDASRQFKIFDNVYVGQKFVELSKEFDVTLASQSSFDRLHWIIYVAKLWSGPISVSIFVPDVEFELTKIYAKKLVDCIPEIRDRVAFHLVYPVSHPPKPIVLDSPLKKEFNCTDLTPMMKEIFKSQNLKNPEFQRWRTSYPYPQSHMRNVARKASQTNYVFLTDIDIVPSKNSAESLSKFLTTNQCSKCAFVVPVYEVDRKSKFPETKSDLKHLISQKKARPFHTTVFLQSQFATNTSLFERDQDDSVVHVSHDVTNYEFFYEPFFVSLDIAPEYDERFVGYGFTRNTQVYEMWESGWSFQVLSPVFAVHYGFQEKRGRPSWREMQNNKNRKKLDRFKAEVRAKYKPLDKPTSASPKKN